MPSLNGILISLALAAPTQNPQADPKPHGEREMAALVDAAQRLLESEAPREQSWGAWLAAEHRLKELIPKLAERLQAALKAEKPEPRLVEALGDALIRNHPVLAPAEVRRLYEAGFETMALIFAAHAPEASHSLLLSIAKDDRQVQDYWICACNLLLRMKSKSFVTSCIEKILVEPLVTLRVEGDPGGGGESYDCIGAGDGFIRREKGWPPVIFYEITLSPTTGYILLAEGPMNIHYQRTVYTREETGFGATHCSRDRDAYRVECLRSLAASSFLPADLLSNISLRPNRTVLWKDRDQLEKDLRGIHLEFRTSWQAFCRALAQKKYLPPDFPDDRFPLIRLKIDDRRPEGQRTPLPPANPGPTTPR